MAKRGRPTNEEKARRLAASMPAEVSIDDLMSKGLKALYGIMGSINEEVALGKPERNTVQNLKDVMSILQTLKKEERDIISAMSEEELEKVVKNDNNQG